MPPSALRDYWRRAPLGRPRRKDTLSPCWIVLEPVNRLPREASRLGDPAKQPTGGWPPSPLGWKRRWSLRIEAGGECVDLPYAALRRMVAGRSSGIYLMLTAKAFRSGRITRARGVELQEGERLGRLWQQGGRCWEKTN
jgi:hypothetical protein